MGVQASIKMETLAKYGMYFHYIPMPVKLQ